jgi:hypothetical protein
MLGAKDDEISTLQDIVKQLQRGKKSVSARRIVLSLTCVRWKLTLT